MNDLLEELDRFNAYYKYPLFAAKINDFVAYFIYLKYLCETGKYTYEEAIKHKEMYNLTNDIYRLARHLDSNKVEINYILKTIQDKDLKQLLIEFLDSLEKPITFHQKNDKILYLCFNHRLYSYYNREGQATYVYEETVKDNFELLKAFDKILGIKNNYVNSSDINITNYDYVYVYDDIPKFRLIKNNIYDDIHKYIENNKNVVLYTNYSKISNFSEGRYIYRFIKTIIIINNKTIMLFNSNDNQEISIIHYDPNIVKDINKVIQNNRKQKDVLVKITHDELKENNLRIGFNLYQLEKNNEIRDINKIVDENTNYLHELNRINERVEREINILLNR